ncbi:hypothetical protein HMPREF0870_01606 [Veillonella atypica KON]|uniref:Uncharacterized protein n=1 Tax=Veillonella atypica KON TaxID=1128111 RepID=A0ABN0IJ65_9FIRM|nr:hypothetical protein HMPREF0870_01606 [Veillonella atypica KON]
MARFRHRRFNAKRMVRSENDSVLLPMARFGIELIAKKDGYLSQNDFALSALWLVFGIEGLMQKGWSVQKTTLSFSLWLISA